MIQTPFYASGLRFSCKRCSTCCRYESGFVFISGEDLKLLCGALNMDSDSFIKAYCRWVPKFDRDCLSLKEKANFDCIFWDQGCKVYDARPFQCRAFPFWENVVASPQAWELAGSGCPGIDSGALHSMETIESLIAARKKQPVIEMPCGGK